MNLEKFETLEDVKKKWPRSFEKLYKEILNTDNGFIEYQEDIAKEEFLTYLVQEKGFLLHGSNEINIEELEPRQANCRSKKFGNMKGVYATNDPILPLFHAIIDKNQSPKSRTISGVERTIDATGIKKEYHFAMDKDALKRQPWTEGVVYILPKETFEQGTDDRGNSIEEWMSREPVKPLAKLKILPEDFRFLNEVGGIE